jgi:hypothetical protein
MVDANCKFIYINEGIQGRISDGGVFGHTLLNEKLLTVSYYLFIYLFIVYLTTLSVSQTI